MKPTTKKWIITIINVVIFIGNAIISALGNGTELAVLSSAVVSTIALI